MAEAMRTATDMDNVEARLGAITRSATEINGKAMVIADKIGGPIPSGSDQTKVSPVSTSTLDHLREIERILAHAYENLNRAENALG